MLDPDSTCLRLRTPHPAEQGNFFGVSSVAIYDRLECCGVAWLQARVGEEDANMPELVTTFGAVA